jgi:hypothetical protein
VSRRSLAGASRGSRGAKTASHCVVVTCLPIQSSSRAMGEGAGIGARGLCGSEVCNRAKAGGEQQCAHGVFLPKVEALAPSCQPDLVRLLSASGFILFRDRWAISYSCFRSRSPAGAPGRSESRIGRRQTQRLACTPKYRIRIRYIMEYLYFSYIRQLDKYSDKSHEICL